MIDAALPTIHAYRDQGSLLEVPTRWSPRVVECTHAEDHADAPGTPYVVKFRQGPVGTAALISEVVSHAILQALELPTLSAALVSVGTALAESYASLGGLGYAVLPGLHFGTVRRLDIYPGPAETWKQLAVPADSVRIWAADCWLMNLDRDTYGNVALTDPDAQGRFRLLPVDHSDCFLGSGSFSDGSYLNRSETYGPAPYARHVERALAEWSTVLLPEMVRRIQNATAVIPVALARVPGDWWKESKVNPGDVERCLKNRAARACDILRVEHWENVSHATAGGKLFQL